MSKVNKILMATVAILLTLVLISTSVVSSVFARFTIKKSAETTVTLEKFGVEIKLTPKQGSLVAKGENVKKGDSVSMQFTSALAMGETLYDALKVEVTGTPSVDVKFRMTCKVEYTTNDYKLPEDTDLYGEGIAGKYYMPLGFTLCIPDANDKINFIDQNYVCRPYQYRKSDRIEEIIIRNTAYKLVGLEYINDANAPNATPTDGSDYYFEVPFKENIKIEDVQNNMKSFYMGFDWLSTATYNGSEYPSTDENVNDRISTFYSEANSPIKITYTFKVVQD